MKKFRAFYLIVIVLFLILTSCTSVNNINLHFMDGDEELSCVKFSSSLNIKFPSDPQKEGYIFDAWYFDEGTWNTPLTLKYLEEVTLKNDIYVYAHWIKDTTDDEQNENDDENNGQIGSVIGNNLTPADIPKLASLTNYGGDASYYDVPALAYNDYTAEKAKLADRIESKQEDAQDPETSSIIKIFAASDAEQIILAMGRAALPTAKMTKTVYYLAGEETISEANIDEKVQSGTWTLTPGWSFFDDLIYYLKLKNISGSKYSTSYDKDNTNRQFRNMAGKILSIGMTGDEFARITTYLQVYSLDVVKDMAGGKTIGTNEFDTYCKTYLDYETLVYLHAFNEYYNGGAGKSDCVELYGYYYDYNKNKYNAISDVDFEKEIQYSYYNIFTDEEWLEYIAIRRDYYANAYRYSDTFYNDFYSKNFSFQEKKEEREYVIYGYNKYSNLTYTGEMRQAITGNGLEGLLAIKDWMWCYGGNEEAMKAYNQANTNYENGKKGGSEAENQGKFYYEMEQLKMVSYLFDNVSIVNISGLLRNIIYKYSSSMLEDISARQKVITLINDGKKAPADATTLLAGIAEDKKKEYATGKIKAIINQMKATYSNVGISQKAQKATNISWASMKVEIEHALNYDYSILSTWAEKVERLEDLVIKRKYDCGAGLDEECLKGNGHAECEKVYDTEHTISQFVSNYQLILRYAEGTVSVNFQQNKYDNPNHKNNYRIDKYASELPITYRCGYGQTQKVTALMLSGVEYFEKKEISIKGGNIFKDEILNAYTKDREWWENYSSPAKADSTVIEWSSLNQQTGTYIYEYTFSGWYLDSELTYRFDENDIIYCDLILYAGYDVTKSVAPNNG